MLLVRLLWERSRSGMQALSQQVSVFVTSFQLPICLLWWVFWLGLGCGPADEATWLYRGSFMMVPCRLKASKHSHWREEFANIFQGCQTTQQFMWQPDMLQVAKILDAGAKRMQEIDPDAGSNIELARLAGCNLLVLCCCHSTL